MTDSSASPVNTAALDELTGGAFSAPTASERAARVRSWLSSEPSEEILQAVFKELVAKDKGAAKPLREKLDDMRRARAQAGVAQEWADKAQTLLEAARLNMADAMAWQRDAAKAGAPLSREPLLSLKTQLADRVKTIEDLQHKAQVYREAGVLMTQRIEVLSTKPWQEALAQQDQLENDWQRWKTDAHALTQAADWPNVDGKFPPMVQSSNLQLQAVWEAFQAALTSAQSAAADRSLPLPAVPAWADQIRLTRGEAQAAATPAPAARPKLDPALREQARSAVKQVMDVLEQEMAAGHGKASAGAAQALRQALKEHARNVDEKWLHKAESVLAAATELQGWQRWRADQLRMELVLKAEALFKPASPKRPAKTHAEIQPPASSFEGAEAVPFDGVSEAMAAALEAAPAGLDEQALAPAESAEPASQQPADPAAPLAAADDANTEAITQAVMHAPTDIPTPAQQPAPVLAAAEQVAALDERVQRRAAQPQPFKGDMLPVMGGRKMQETLRQLREQWKLTDQGGPPNHGLWKRFDTACNQAHKVVEVWLDKVRAESAATKAQRQGLIEELNAWAQAHAQGPDWKSVARALFGFEQRWRDGGHMNEKAFTEVQSAWREAMARARAHLDAAQKASTERREVLIAQAQELAQAATLRVDAVKSLQQRWQAEAQTIVLERRLEQKMWDAFRQPIDEAFQRKTAQRDTVQGALSERDKAVLQAAKALEQANASQDAAAIRAAMRQLDQAMRGEAVQAAPAAAAAPTPSAAEQAAPAQAAPVVAVDGDGSSAVLSADSQVDVLLGPAQAEPASPTDAVPAEPAAQADASPAKPAARPAKPVVAVRGDDRPGLKKAEAAPAGRGFKGRDGRDGPPRGNDRGDRFGDKPRGPTGRPGGFDGPGRAAGFRGEREDIGPRLGDSAFRAQRQALEQAQFALQKLAAQAHGETLTHLLSAWEKRDTTLVPPLSELGPKLNASQRTQWTQALAAPAQQPADQALLRLEIAAELPSPAQAVEARRQLQLLLLTRRNDPTPQQTWAKDAAQVMSGHHSGDAARRLQNTLKVLLKR